MKLLLIVFLTVLSVVVFAGTHSIHHPRLRVSSPCKVLPSITWKTIVAGGAAAGTIISAYKLSDGVEEGIKIIAKEKPDVFADALSVLTWPIRWAAFVLLLFFGYRLAKKLLKRKTTSPTKE